MDELLLSKVRLAVVAHLLAAEWVPFSDLAAVVETTHGNLGSHLARLVAAGYLQEDKSFVGRRPRSRYRLTAAGRRAFLRHVDQLRALADGAG